FRTRLPELASHLAAQLSVRVQLRQSAEGCYARAVTEIEEATGNGSLLHGEGLARWQDVAGTGDLVPDLQSRRRGPAGRPRPRGISARARALKAAVSTGLESLILSVGDRTAEEAVARWRDHPAGVALLEEAPALMRLRAVRQRPLVRAGRSPFDDE